MAKRKDKQISDDDRAFYRLGVLEGERQARDKMLLTQATNKNLWELLVEQDDQDARRGVIIPFAKMEKMIKGLRKPPAKHYWARKLEAMLKDAQAKTGIFQELAE